MNDINKLVTYGASLTFGVISEQDKDPNDPQYKDEYKAQLFRLSNELTQSKDQDQCKK